MKIDEIPLGSLLVNGQGVFFTFEDVTTVKTKEQLSCVDDTVAVMGTTLAGTPFKETYEESYLWTVISRGSGPTGTRHALVSSSA